MTHTAGQNSFFLIFGLIIYHVVIYLIIPLWRHSLLYHGGSEAEFAMSVTALHPSVTAWKPREGTNIISGDSDMLMNSKLEFLQGPFLTPEDSGSCA